MWFKQGSNVM